MMKLKKILLGAIIFILTCETLLFSFSPFVRANRETIPENYYQDLDLKGLYVYNVTAFGDKTNWFNYSDFSSLGYFLTNPGGQIHLAISGFYIDKNHGYSPFSFPIPFMNITIFNKTDTGLNENFYAENRSQNEIANNLFLGYYGYFTPGFLAPKNFTWLNETAQFAASSSGKVNLSVEETYHFIQFDFNETSDTYFQQHTELTYDKKTGFLVHAKTSHVLGYTLEICSLNFSLSYNIPYNYDVLKFGEERGWYNFSSGDAFEGNFATNPTGVIQVNFTSDYNKDINDMGNILGDPIPWLNISILKNLSGVLVQNFTLFNRSNGEVARALILGYENFQSGFHILYKNLTNIEDQAFQQKDGINKGNVSIIETGLTFQIYYNQYPSGQKTYMIYEKISGLLLWAETTNETYLLELSLRYDSVFGAKPPTQDLPDNSLIPPIIIYFPYLIIIIASLAIGVPFGFIQRIDMKIRKFIIIAAIGVCCFSGLFFFNDNMSTFIKLANTPLNEVENITLIIDYGNGTQDTWVNFSLSSGKTTVYDALTMWCDVEGELYGSQFFITSINGKASDGSSGWGYTLQGSDGSFKPAGEVTTTILSDGDVITFTYG